MCQCSFRAPPFNGRVFSPFIPYDWSQITCVHALMLVFPNCSRKYTTFLLDTKEKQKQKQKLKSNECIHVCVCMIYTSLMYHQHLLDVVVCTIGHIVVVVANEERDGKKHSKATTIHIIIVILVWQKRRGISCYPNNFFFLAWITDNQSYLYKYQSYSKPSRMKFRIIRTAEILLLLLLFCTLQFVGTKMIFISMVLHPNCIKFRL